MEENNRIVGVIGAILGGFVAAIPWIVMYVYGNIITALLAILIAMGSLKGYQLLKGRMDGKVPVIIAIVSIGVIIISTLLIIPCLLMVKENIPVTVYNLGLLYDYAPFRNAILGDLLLSVVFAFLGISGVIKNLKNQLNNDSVGKIDILNSNPNYQENFDMVKNIFEKYQAFDKLSAIDKEIVLAELNQEDAEDVFTEFKIQNIICKSDDRYYFNKKARKNSSKNMIVWMVILFLIIFIIGLFN